MTDEPFEVVDPSGLTDADWAEINKLRKAHESGGQRQLKKAFDELSKDPIRCVRVVGAFFPDQTRESIKDVLAEQGMDEEDVREIIRKPKSLHRDQ